MASEPVSLHVAPDRCAVIVADGIGRALGNCGALPTRRGRWRFETHVARVVLCAEHADQLAGHERLALDQGA